MFPFLGPAGYPDTDGTQDERPMERHFCGSPLEMVPRKTFRITFELVPWKGFIGSALRIQEVRDGAWVFGVSFGDGPWSSSFESGGFRLGLGQATEGLCLVGSKSRFCPLGWVGSGVQRDLSGIVPSVQPGLVGQLRLKWPPCSIFPEPAQRNLPVFSAIGP